MSMSLQIYIGPYAECHVKRRAPWLYNVIDEQEQALSSVDMDDGIMRLIPNVYRDGMPRSGIDFDAVGALDMHNVDTCTEIAWMKSAFATELAQVCAAYGDVTMRWGLLRWYA